MKYHVAQLNDPVLKTWAVFEIICNFGATLNLAFQPGSTAGADIEYQLLEAAKAGDLELVKKIVADHPHIVNCRYTQSHIHKSHQQMCQPQRPKNHKFVKIYRTFSHKLTIFYPS